MEARGVLVLATGGTVSMTTAPSGGVAPALDAATLVLTARSTETVVARDAARVPGAHLTLNELWLLADAIDEAASDRYDGVVVAQGTDTIEEIAFALDLLVDDHVTTVVTGAMRSPAFEGADGAANLSDAITVAGDDGCRGAGVLVVLAGEIHAATLVRKAHSSALDAFESYPGALGWLSEGVAELKLRPTKRYPRLARPNVLPARLPQVAVVTVTLADDATLLARIADDPPDALVVDAFGAGHVPPTWVNPITAVASERPVVLCSRTRRGPLLLRTYDFAGSERDLLDRGVIAAGSLDFAKAAIALRLLLLCGSDQAAIRSFFGHRTRYTAG